MSARKPAKAKPCAASGPTLEQRIATVEAAREFDGEWLEEINKRLDALETRDRLRDKSNDEPVSNASEAIGQHFRIIDERPRPTWWRTFFGFMGSP